jgi:hypothetical protein
MAPYRIVRSVVACIMGHDLASCSISWTNQVPREDLQ